MKVELTQIDARHLAARAGDSAALALDHLSIASGEQVAVIGPSGAGKTTLLELIASALQPRRGKVELDGQNPWQMRSKMQQRLRGRLFLAPQTPPLPPRQRVVTAVLAGALPSMSLFASLRSLFYPIDIPGAHAALEAFDLAEKLSGVTGSSVDDADARNDVVDHDGNSERQALGYCSKCDPFVNYIRTPRFHPDSPE